MDTTGPFFGQVFAVCAAGVLVAAFLILRLVRRDYKQQGQLSPLTSFLQVLMFFLLGTLVSLAYGFKWRLPLTNRPVCIILGLMVGLGGLVMLAGALREFGPIERMFGLYKGNLTRSGIYDWTRNPQIVGYGLILLSIPLFWPSWYGLASVLLYWPIAHMMVLVEEEHLENVFGDQYREYCVRTPRYLAISRFKRT